MEIDEHYARIVSLGLEWSEMDAAASLLEESKKSVRAQMAMKHMKTAGGTGKAELMADADETYVDHLKAMVEARRKANIANINYRSALVYADLWRSQESSRRAELQTLKG